MSKKRSDLDIVADILRIAKKGARKSHIVYKANLNFQLVERYLTKLQKAGLIVFPLHESFLFTTTSNGIEYISRYENLVNYIHYQHFSSDEK